jgi:hypothetical protein
VKPNVSDAPSIPRVWVDFCKGGGNQIILTTIGTRNDLARQQLEFREGMYFQFYQDDANELNEPGFLYAEGTVHWHAAEQHWWATIGEIRWNAATISPPSGNSKK